MPQHGVFIVYIDFQTQIVFVSDLQHCNTLSDCIALLQAAAFVCTFVQITHLPSRRVKPGGTELRNIYCLIIAGQKSSHTHACAMRVM
jgi:hypothetical protein